MVAASIRYNNPGAVWGGNTVARRWGAGSSAVTLNDGFKQGNNIAVFPTKLQGACAQFDLWRSSYCELTLEAAIKKWSGGNSSLAYMKLLQAAAGIPSSTPITQELLASPIGIKLLKAQAQWEAGIPYPLSDADWAQAQAAVFRGIKPKLPLTTNQKKTGAVVAVGTATTGAVVKAASTGQHWGIVLIIGVVGALVGLAGWFYFHHKG